MSEHLNTRTPEHPNTDPNAGQKQAGTKQKRLRADEFAQAGKRGMPGFVGQIAQMPECPPVVLRVPPQNARVQEQRKGERGVGFRASEPFAMRGRDKEKQEQAGQNQQHGMLAEKSQSYRQPRPNPRAFLRGLGGSEKGAFQKYQGKRPEEYKRRVVGGDQAAHCHERGRAEQNNGKEPREW